MRKFIPILLLFSPIILSAQNNKQIPSILHGKVEKVEFSSRSTFPYIIRFSSKEAPLANNLKNDNTWANSVFPLRQADNLKYISQYTDKDTNDEFYKFQQTYKSIPIEYGLIKAKVKANKILSIVGDYYSDVTPQNNISISNEAAIQFAKTDIDAIGYDKVSTTLVVFPMDNIFLYAYKTEVYTFQQKERYMVYINAETGAVLKKISMMCTIDVKGNAQTKYHGLQQIQTDSIAPNTFILREKNRKNRGMQIETRNAQSGFEQNSVDFTDSDNFWNNINTAKDEVATDCHFGIEMTYDYYFDSLGRDSYDDGGAKILQYVHFENNWFNAQWTGSSIRYGDGNGEPLTSIDIISHEFTHGVTEYTAGLEYQKESGALNESFSDIFGTVVEFTKFSSGASWIIGKNSFSLRNMSNPNAFNNPDCYGGKFWTNVINCTPSNANDWCGVHNNSGVQNFWFYLLCVGDTGVNDIGNSYKVQPIGMNKAAKIAYKNLRDYLNPTSDYAEARMGSIQAAIDLYGYDSPEMIAVMNAWHAVGVGQVYSRLPIAQFKLASPICDPFSIANFVNTTSTAQSYLWDFGDGTTSTEENPSHEYTSVGNYTVQLIATNPNGSDTIRKENFVKIFTEKPIASTCAVNMLTPIGTTGIYKVEFAGIENESQGPQIEDPYVDFTCNRADVITNEYYPIKITTYVTSPVFTRVYIDWNNNGGFDLPEELVMSTNNTLQYHYDTLQVPSNSVTNTPIRMRVVSAKATNNTPDIVCSGLRNGQIEDYTVYVNSSLAVSSKHEVLFNVYPNPSNSHIFIQSTTDQHLLKMFNLLGEEVFSQNFVNSTKLNVSNLPAGIYILKLETNGVVQVQKIVVN